MKSGNITYLINHIEYGGAEVGMVRLASGLVERGFEVSIITLKGSNPDLANQLPASIEVTELNIPTGLTQSSVRRATKLISESDILVCSLFPSSIVGTLFGNLLGAESIYTWKHVSVETNPLKKRLKYVAFQLSDQILSDSEAAAETVKSWGFSDERITILPISGINIDQFPTVTHTEKEIVRVGTVGRLVKQKGYFELLESAKQLPDCEFHIVGEGPLEEELKKGPDNVCVHGGLDQGDLDELWSTFDIYFQPSHYEGLCITAIEAMACGLPVVASDTDGLSESVVHGKTGFLVPRKDIKGYVKYIKTLSTDYELRSELGKAGRIRVEESYSQDAFVTSFLTLE